MGGIAAASEAYRNSPTPNVILIETDSRTDEILSGLDQLAEVCDAGTRVIVVGRVNDVALYRGLTRRGVSEYLIGPIGTTRRRAGDLQSVLRTRRQGGRSYYSRRRR